MKNFIFLDRDGTIIVDKHYLCDPEGVELLPNAAEGLCMMSEMGFGLIVVTNQSGIGRGYYSEEEMSAVNRRMKELLAEHGVRIDGIYHCPHSPGEPCNCRKPLTGMFEQAAADFTLNAENCYMIGDKECDIDAGTNFGSRPILVRTGKGTAEEQKCAQKACYVADDLLDAAKFISRNS